MSDIDTIRLGDIDYDIKTPTGDTVRVKDKNGNNVLLQTVLDGLYLGSIDNPILYVFGDSTATDKPTSKAGYTHYNTECSIYKALAKLLNCQKANYHNFGVGGTKIANLKSNFNNVAASNDSNIIIFIQLGINNLSDSAELGTIDTIIRNTDLTNIDDMDESSPLALYWKYLLKLRKKCPNAKIYCMTPLLHVYSGDMNTKYQTLRDAIKKMVDALQIGIDINKIHYIDGHTVGWHAVDSSNNFYTVDGLHPTKQGAIYIAKNIYYQMLGLDQSVFEDGVVASITDVDGNYLSQLEFVGSTNTDIEKTIYISCNNCDSLTLSLSQSSYNSLFTITPSEIVATNKCVKNVPVTVKANAAQPINYASDAFSLRVYLNGGNDYPVYTNLILRIS